jgi:hypothetical protein
MRQLEALTAAEAREVVFSHRIYICKFVCRVSSAPARAVKTGLRGPSEASGIQACGTSMS